MPVIRCSKCDSMINQKKFNQQVRERNLSITQLQEFLPIDGDLLCHKCDARIPYEDSKIFVHKYLLQSRERVIICRNCRGVMDKNKFSKEFRINKWNSTPPPQNQELMCKKCEEPIPYERWEGRFQEYLKSKKTNNRCPSCRMKFTFRRFLKAIEINNLKLGRMDKLMPTGKTQKLDARNVLMKSLMTY
ncbi:hypothetical protein [Priestia aryabhattai]